MRQLTLIAIAVVALSACQLDADLGGGVVTVYEAGPVVQQCSAAVVTVAQSAQKLSIAGISAANSSCGVVSGVAYPAVCGAGTGQILVHDIPADGMQAAKQAGFLPASALVDAAQGRGWERVSCPN